MADQQGSIDRRMKDVRITHADNLDDAARALLPSAGAVVTTASGAYRLGGACDLTPWATTGSNPDQRRFLQIRV
jgi:hypothetical protein